MSFDIPDEYDGYVQPHIDELPEVFYHVAPKANRKSIADEGLFVDESRTHNTGGSYSDDPDDEWLYEDYGEGAMKAEWRPHGVYVWPTLERALEYQDKDLHDIYEIDREDVMCDIIRDPSVATNWDYEERNKAYVLEYAQEATLMDQEMIEKRLRPALAKIEDEEISSSYDVSKDQLSFDF